MLEITPNISLPLDQIELNAIRSQGAGGQNVNKVSSAIHLRFDIQASSLPFWLKQKLLEQSDKRVTSDGVMIIKAQQHRTQEQNREDALRRLAEWVRAATVIRKTRKATRPTRGSQKRRMDSKTKRGRTKSLRGKPTGMD